MIYFIPAWYNKNTWSEREQQWYVPREKSEFDDTIKQIQLFHRSKSYEYEVALLNYAPNFRHFLHRQSIFRAPYWSCFDAIQNIRRKKVGILSYLNLKWPEGIEFRYTPFLVVAYMDGQLYASVDFAEDGNLIQINMYSQGNIVRTNLYDDRGFVSSTIVYENGKPVYQDFLDEESKWKIRLVLFDGHVEVNPESAQYLLFGTNGKEQLVDYKKNSYSSLDEVIYEVFRSYVGRTAGDSIFCVALHEKNIILLQDILKNRNTILSVYSDRYELSQLSHIKEMLNNVHYIIADSREQAIKVVESTDIELERILDIPPFDSRIDVGISQLINTQSIMVPIDGLEQDTFIKLILILNKYVNEHQDTSVTLFTRKAGYNVCETLQESVSRILRLDLSQYDWGEEFDESILELNTKKHMSFEVEQCVDEASVTRCIRKQRILLDMRNIPDLYLRIAAVSTGIPQIISRHSQFVIDGKNGYRINDIKGIEGKLSYYLDNMSNWNEAQVYSFELGEKYTTEKLLESWKEVIGSFELY